MRYEITLAPSANDDLQRLKANVRAAVRAAIDDDWFDYCLESDRRFLERIASARESLRAGKGIRLEDLD